MFRLIETPSGADAPSLSEELDGEGIDRPAERAYQGIRRAILRGVLASGSHLGEEALAKMTGTSRTPVREALRRLVAEGLARADQRHRFVADFSFEEVAVVFEIRARLESFAARIAATTITESELSALDEIVAAIDTIEPAQDDAALARFVELNTRFHASVVKATHSAQMQTLSAQALSLPLELIKQFVWEQRVNIARSNEQHRDIVAALRAKNPDWAEASMSGHILSTRPAHKPDGHIIQ